MAGEASSRLLYHYDMSREIEMQIKTWEKDKFFGNIIAREAIWWA